MTSGIEGAGASVISSGDLFGENAESTIIASIIAIFIGAITTVAGVGGGGLFVLVYGFVYGIGAKASVPLSAATILGGAIGKYFRTSTEKHPSLNRCLINYDVAVFVQTAEVIGTIFGVLLNYVLPNIVVISLLFIVLSYTAHKTWIKGRKMYKKESEMLKAESEAIELTSVNGNGASHVSSSSSVIKAAEPYSQFNTFSMSRSITLSATVLTCSLIKVYDCISLMTLSKLLLMDGFCERQLAIYWIINFTPIIFAGLFYVNIIKKLQTPVELDNVELTSASQTGVVSWDKKTMTQLIGLGLFSGTASGLLGIGGGMITGPYFLDKLDLVPVESTATTSYMIIFTALSGVTQYWSTARLHWASALWGIALGLVGGLLGQELVRKAFEKLGRQSLIILFLAVLIVCSVFGIVSMGIYEIVKSSSQILDTENM